MTTKNLKLAQALFPILTAAVLAAACSGDSTGPSTGTGSEGDGTTIEQPQAGTPPPISTTTPPAGPSAAPPGRSKAAHSGPVKISAELLVVSGDVYPCQWYNGWCYRWVSLNAPVWLYLAVQFTSDYVFVHEQLWNSGQPWTLRYAISRYDQTVWSWNGFEWKLYQPISVPLTSNTFIIGAPDGCGLGALCTTGMLNPANVLRNGMPVSEFLKRLTSGT